MLVDEDELPLPLLNINADHSNLVSVNEVVLLPYKDGSLYQDQALSFRQDVRIVSPIYL